MEQVTESAPSPAQSLAPYPALAPAPALTQFFDSTYAAHIQLYTVQYSTVQ
jgi:hypothetical protein